MNRKQLVAMWAGVVVFVVAGLCPRWEQSGIGWVQWHEFNWIWSPLQNARPSLALLSIEWMIVAGVTLAGVITLRGTKVTKGS